MAQVQKAQRRLEALEHREAEREERAEQKPKDAGDLEKTNGMLEKLLEVGAALAGISRELRSHELPGPPPQVLKPSSPQKEAPAK